MRTTSAEVITAFAVTPRARELLRRWQADQARRQVPRVVMPHVTQALYRLEPSHIEAVCAASDHPLGDIRKDVAMAVRPVVDWCPDFAFTLPEAGQIRAVARRMKRGQYTRQECLIRRP